MICDYHFGVKRLYTNGVKQLNLYKNEKRRMKFLPILENESENPGRGLLPLIE